MLQKLAKPNLTDRWAAESEPEPKHLQTIAAGAEAKNFYTVEPKPEPEIWVPLRGCSAKKRGVGTPFPNKKAE